MRSPSRSDARRVGLGDDQLVTPLNRDDSQQLGGLGTLPATHASAYRRRAAYHAESLPRRLGMSRAVVPAATVRGRAIRRMHAPLALTPGWVERTAIFVR